MPRPKAVIATLACCAYPLLSHLGALAGEPLWPAAGIALIAWAALSVRLSALRAAALAVLILVLGVSLSMFSPALLVYSPPVVLNVLLCAVFARTLRPGGEAMISRFARIEHGSALPPDLVRYTRFLTGLWATFFAAMAMASIALALWGSVGAWSLFTNLLNYLLVVLLFTLEYLYRRLRYRHYRHVSPGELVRRLHTYRIFPRHADGS